MVGGAQAVRQRSQVSSRQMATAHGGRRTSDAAGCGVDALNMVTLTPDLVHCFQVAILEGLVKLTLRLLHGSTTVVLAVAELVPQASRCSVVLFADCQVELCLQVSHRPVCALHPHLRAPVSCALYRRASAERSGTSVKRL